MELTISRAMLDEIRSSASASPSAEICGLLLGRGAVVTQVRPCDNIAADPRNSFEIDPAALIAAHRAARAGGAPPIGHYHSHPNGSPFPSERDAAAAEPGSYWIIVGEDELLCWYADGRGRFRAVTIVAAHNR